MSVAFWIAAASVAAFVGWYLYEKSQRRSYPVEPGFRAEITLPHTEEWELYQNSLSLCAKKLRVCLAELELPHKSHHVHLIETGQYGTLSREYLKVNPGFTVPVLLHNGHPIYESHEQIFYAAKHAGAKGEELLGRDAKTRAEVERWVDLSSLKSVFHPEERAGEAVPGLTVPLFSAMMKYIPYRRLVEGLLFHPDRKRPILFTLLKLRGLKRLPTFVVPLVQSARKYMHIHLDELEEHLGHGQPWICGEDFTLADISWVVVLERLNEADWADVFWAKGQRPRVAAYWERLTKRPSYEAALGSHRGEIQIAALEDIRAAKRESPELRALLETS